MIRKLRRAWDRYRFERQFPRVKARRLHRKAERKMQGRA